MALNFLKTLPHVIFVRLTEQFISEHVELLLVQASLGDGGELPAEHLRELRPLRRRRGEEELQVLENMTVGDR